MNQLSWITDIENYEQHLCELLKEYGDLKLLYDILQQKSGPEAFLDIASTFLKTNIKIVEKPFNEMKKVYVYQNRDLPVAKLAREMGVDERTVYAWLAEFGCKRNGNNKDDKTIDMFEG